MNNKQITSRSQGQGQDSKRKINEVRFVYIGGKLKDMEKTVRKMRRCDNDKQHFFKHLDSRN